MRTFTKIISLSILSTFIFIGCAKQSNTPAAESASLSNATEESVLTPAGYMPKSKVHFIEQGYHVSIENGHYKKIENASGKMVEDFGEVEINNALNLGKPNNIEPKPSGWITYADWSNDTTTHSPVTYFNTDWIVPKAPKNNDGQTVFLFNGMQDGFTSKSHILQPVLQWGGSAAGGGNYWAITNWYVGSSAFYGALVNVSTGTALQGIIQQIGTAGKLHSYTSSFVGYPTTDIEIDNAPQLWWSAETLEAYSISKNSDYPADKDVKMSGIEILKGTSEASITWEAVKDFTKGPQNTTIVNNASPGGEVDIYFKK